MLAEFLSLVPQEAAEASAFAGYVSIILRSIFVENVLLAFFLGMCSYLAVSKRVDSSVGLGLAVVFVLALIVPLNWVIQRFILDPGALAWAGIPNSDLSYLQFLTFIASIATAVQVVEMAIVSMAAIRWRLRTAHIPAPLKGLGITFITTGLVAMAFQTFGGI